MEITRESIFKKCEELGEEEVRNKIHLWLSRKRKFAEEWLALQDSNRAKELSDRSEYREQEAISLAKEANSIDRATLDEAKEANSIARKALSEAREANSLASRSSLLAKISIGIAAISTIPAIIKFIISIVDIVSKTTP